MPGSSRSLTTAPRKKPGMDRAFLLSGFRLPLSRQLSDRTARQMERPLSKASLAMPADVSYPRRVFRAVTIPILFSTS